MTFYDRRRLTNYTALTLAVGAAAIGLFWLIAILWTLVYNGLEGLSTAVFTQPTPRRAAPAVSPMRSSAAW